jgi:ribosomal-protein-alanine N-acetyltransferase
MSFTRKVGSDDLGLSLRKLVLSDVPAITVILAESPEAAAWSQDSLEQLASIDGAGWIAEQDRVIAGFLLGRIAADEFEILNMAVSRDLRRSGIGSKLLASALEFARVAGAARAYLDVRASNQPAIALYARRGFTECGRRARYYRDPVEDALLLSLHLVETGSV